MSFGSRKRGLPLGDTCHESVNLICSSRRNLRVPASHRVYNFAGPDSAGNLRLKFLICSQEQTFLASSALNAEEKNEVSISQVCLCVGGFHLFGSLAHGM